nr:MAG TPA: hypothetical protein [Caudoviricetes sp.]
MINAYSIRFLISVSISFYLFSFSLFLNNKKDAFN